MITSWQLVIFVTILSLDALSIPVISGLPVARKTGGEENSNVKDIAQEELKKPAEPEKPVGEKLHVEDEHGLKFENEPEPKIELDLDMVKKLEKLPLDKLKPVDHMDGVKLEQDGHVNKEYHKELFLGDSHDEFRQEAFDEAEDKLKEIVEKADTDKDNHLSRQEMEAWIVSNINKHKKEAFEENEQIFKHLDPDGDGFVKWKEYYGHFLLSRGFEPEQVVTHLKDYDEETLQMDPDDRELLVTYKFKWTDADKEPTDNKLSKAEFMVFRHPEQSPNSLKSMVENVMRSIDANGDNLVSIDEFSALPEGEVEGEEFKEMDKKWQAERHKEFKEILDLNKDGVVTSEEMKRYLDPLNPIQAKIETESLLSLIDADHDGMLSMHEILDRADIFITSKLANFGANVHDEF